MSSLLQSDFPSTRSPASVAGESNGLPARLIARDYRLTPERTAEGRESGVSAAIWSRRDDRPAEYRRAALADFHALTVRLNAQKVERWHDGRRIPDGDPRPGASALLRAGIMPRLVVYGPSRSFQLYLPKSLVEESASIMDVGSWILERLGSSISYDAVIDHLAQQAVHELESGSPGSRLQLDAIGTMLSVHLLRCAAGAQACRTATQGGLAGWQVRRIQDCIAARLDGNPSLASLAREVGLSRYHFVRAFKQSTGQSPHQYLLNCRLKRAKDLLAKTDASIADIAASVGYDDPTQLARLFRMELDMTPSGYRKAFSR